MSTSQSDPSRSRRDWAAADASSEFAATEILGSSGKCVLAAGENELGFMQAIELEDEESLVAVAVGPALQVFDLVIDPFQFARRDRMVKIVEDAAGMDPQR